MPLYKYECPTCKAIKERIRPVALRDRAMWCDDGKVGSVHHPPTKMERVEYPGSSFTIEADYV